MMNARFFWLLTCNLFLSVKSNRECGFGTDAVLVRCGQALIGQAEVGPSSIRPTFEDIFDSCQTYHTYRSCVAGIPTYCRKSLIDRLEVMYELICVQFLPKIASQSECFKALESDTTTVDCIHNRTNSISMNFTKQPLCFDMQVYIDCALTEEFVEKCPVAAEIEFNLLSEYLNSTNAECFLAKPEALLNYRDDSIADCNNETGCTCSKGFAYNETSLKCEDIDECRLETHQCSQKCLNTHGGYTCKCDSRYFKLAKDTRNCVRIDGEVPWIFFAHGQSIWNVSMDGESFLLEKAGLQKVAMIDLDIKNKDVYCVDIGLNVIEIINLDGAPTRKIQTFEVDGTEGIAVDWIGRNLYSLKRTDLMVQKLDGQFRKMLYKRFFRLPRTLVIHVAKGLLFASDWSSSAFIARLAMDGSTASKIITGDIVWPNALSIDLFADRLYWADAFLDMIYSSDLEGNHRQIVIGESGAVPHIFSLAILDNFIYWTDWTYRGILRANKITGDNITVLAQTALLPYTIKIFHSSSQPIENNPCERAGCSQLCLISDDGKQAKCLCGDGYIIQNDNKTCKSRCLSTEILCDGSEPKCLNKVHVCDGIVHCKDQSDEHGCPSRLCPAGYLQCPNSKRCIAPAYICDGSAECEDNSDEKYCAIK